MEGFTVLTAADGQEGVDRTREERPDVIVSDVMMPRKSGLELVAELKGDPDTAGIPVLLLTAKAQQADIADGLEKGADDYVTKPFEPLELIDRVNRRLADAWSGWRSRRPCGHPAGRAPRRPDRRAAGSAGRRRRRTAVGDPPRAAGAPGARRLVVERRHG